jgi:hypothetical protein
LNEQVFVRLELFEKFPLVVHGGLVVIEHESRKNRLEKYLDLVLPFFPST